GLDYKRGDGVVFQLASIDIEEGLVKRIIGLPGDKVRISQNSVFINNTRMTEVYIPSGFQTGGGSFLFEGDEITVPQDSFFVMGDNREHSLDSRFKEVGFVKRGNLLGKVILRVWPFSDLSLIGTGEYSL